MNKLIPKYLTAWGKLEYKGPQYSEVLSLMKSENPLVYKRLLAERAKSKLPHSEVVIDDEGNTVTNVGAGYMSGTDPLGGLYVSGVALDPIFRWLGKLTLIGAGKMGSNWARAKLISREMVPKKSNLLNVQRGFRNQEWVNLGNQLNGNNYYRYLYDLKPIQGNYSNFFISHTTPWEEFSSNGGNILLEFPHKTFGDLKSTTWQGIKTDNLVSDMGYNNLHYGLFASGKRGPIKVPISTDGYTKMLLLMKSGLRKEFSENPEIINFGLIERPLINGKYDLVPDYSHIWLGNLTTISKEALNNAILNTNYNIYLKIPEGIVKNKYIGNISRLKEPKTINWKNIINNYE